MIKRKTESVSAAGISKETNGWMCRPGKSTDFSQHLILPGKDFTRFQSIDDLRASIQAGAKPISDATENTFQ